MTKRRRHMFCLHHLIAFILCFSNQSINGFMFCYSLEAHYILSIHFRYEKRGDMDNWLNDANCSPLLFCYHQMTLAAGNNIDTTTSSTCCCLSSSTIVYRFSRRQSVIVGLVTMFALMALMLVYYSVDTQTMVSAFVMPKSAPAHYSLDQMKEFAFKNSIHTDYKPSYYTRRNLSFSRIIEDPNNR